MEQALHSSVCNVTYDIHIHIPRQLVIGSSLAIDIGLLAYASGPREESKAVSTTLNIFPTHVLSYHWQVAAHTGCSNVSTLSDSCKTQPRD